MRAHLLALDGQTIENTVEVESLNDLPGLVDAAIGGSIGDRVVAGVIVPQAVPAIDLAGPSLQEQVTVQAQQRLDAFARTRNYDGILSACTYAVSRIPKFAAEGQAAINARDATWAALYSVLDQVQAGELPMPTGFADIEPLLPALAWPA